MDIPQLLVKGVWPAAITATSFLKDYLHKNFYQ